MILEGTTTTKLLLIIDSSNVEQVVKHSGRPNVEEGICRGFFSSQQKAVYQKTSFFACNQTAGAKGDMTPFGMWALK